jgi:hypothetical protein
VLELDQRFGRVFGTVKLSAFPKQNTMPERKHDERTQETVSGSGGGYNVGCYPTRDVSAQTSGIGGDGYTRVLWRGTDGRISLWKLDPVLNFVTYHEYGPYAGYSPIAITTAHNNNTYVLWRNTDDSISLWLVDANLNFVAYHAYGPYAGWIAKSLSVDTNTNNTFRLTWRNTDGSISLWFLDQNLNFVRYHQDGPFFGYDPGSTD